MVLHAPVAGDARGILHGADQAAVVALSVRQASGPGPSKGPMEVRVGAPVRIKLRTRISLKFHCNFERLLEPLLAAMTGYWWAVHCRTARRSTHHTIGASLSLPGRGDRPRFRADRHFSRMARDATSVAMEAHRAHSHDHSPTR